MKRNDVITTLEVLRSNCSKHSRDYQALNYAINSLKTDEAYQIMYEGGEIFTEDDMVDMLKEIQLEIEEIVKEEELIDKKWANGLHYSEKIIQQKIDALKEQTDDKA